MHTFNLKTAIFPLVVSLACMVSGIALADTVEISGLNAPFQLGQLNPFGVGTAVDKDLCVYSSTGAYQVTARGNGPGAGFGSTLALPNAKTIEYQVFWNNNSGTAGNFQLLAGQLSPRQTQTGNSNCTTASGNAGYRANLQIIIPDGQLQGAAAGHYAPVLQIDITPALQ